MKSELDPGNLVSFPITGKGQLNARYRDFMSPRLRASYDGGASRGYDWVEVRSGGTTGVPVAVIHGPDFRDHDRALRMYEMDMCGFPFGTPYFRLWGSMQDINQMRNSTHHRVMSWLAHEKILNAFKMEAADMDRYLDCIQQGDASHMMAYIDAAERLARHASGRGRTVRLTAIMACAGTVTGSARQVIHQAFGARIHNKYGSRDAGEIACECADGGLHLLPGVFVEVVDPQGRACAPGESGRLLITCLHNRDFPIIRYEIGDTGALSTDACRCGLPFPCLDRLEGRTTDFLFSTGGGFISPVYIRHLVGVVHPPPGLRRFQLEQTGSSQFILRIEREHGSPAFDDSLLRRDLLRVVGEHATLDIVQLDRIPESASGKFRYTIRRDDSPFR